MRRHTTLVEVRPYGFEGEQPDSCFKEPLRLSANAVFHITVPMGAPELCDPVRGLDFPPLGVPRWSLRLSCKLPPQTLRRALRHALWFNASPPRYASARPPARTIFAYPSTTEQIRP